VIAFSLIDREKLRRQAASRFNAFG